MDFSARQRDPRRHLVGLGAVIAFHVLIVWALLTGLAKKVVDVVRAPIETKVIEEVKKPPPPPEIVVPPPPRLEAPPPPFIPPPEVQIATPPPPAPTITAVPTPPPPAPVAIVPTPPPEAPPAPPAPPPPAPTAGVICPDYPKQMGDAGYPKEALRAGIEKGEALVEFVVGPSGEIKSVRTVQASHPLFARASARTVSGFKCKGQGKDVVVRVPFVYKVE
jgi:protein TonB